jgi:hypothetical protein
VDATRFFNNDIERDMTYIGSCSIQYLGCISYVGIGEDGIVRQENWVNFGLGSYWNDLTTACYFKDQDKMYWINPYNSYVVPMSTYLDAYVEYKMEIVERQCEQIREYCGCENDDQVLKWTGS